MRGGTVAVVDGDLLVGRVADDPATLTCQLVPLGSTGDLGSRDLQARILPLDDALVDPDRRTVGEPIILQSMPGTDDFEGLVERRVDVEVGAPVRLGMDQAWHQTAWGMLIGTVVQIDSVPSKPLRKRVVVRVATAPERLAVVTLKIQNASDDTRAWVPDSEDTP